MTNLREAMHEYADEISVGLGANAIRERARSIRRRRWAATITGTAGLTAGIVLLTVLVAPSGPASQRPVVPSGRSASLHRCIDGSPDDYAHPQKESPSHAPSSAGDSTSPVSGGTPVAHSTDHRTHTSSVPAPGGSFMRIGRWQQSIQQYINQLICVADAQPNHADSGFLNKVHGFRLSGVGAPAPAVANLMRQAPQSVTVSWQRVRFTAAQLAFARREAWQYRYRQLVTWVGLRPEHVLLGVDLPRGVTLAEARTAVDKLVTNGVPVWVVRSHYAGLAQPHSHPGEPCVQGVRQPACP